MFGVFVVDFLILILDSAFDSAGSYYGRGKCYHVVL